MVQSKQHNNAPHDQWLKLNFIYLFIVMNHSATHDVTWAILTLMKEDWTIGIDFGPL